MAKMKCKKCDGELFYLEKNPVDNDSHILVCNGCQVTVALIENDELDFYGNTIEEIA
jgi:Zn finger protein HypA/HybF involved in hydrogenase expression